MVTMVADFFIIHANTPLAGFSFASKNMPKGVGRFPLASPQCIHNEIKALYTITFLPPGSFLLQLYSAFDDDLQGICSYSMVMLFTTFARIILSPREDKVFSSRREKFLPAKRKIFVWFVF